MIFSKRCVNLPPEISSNQLKGQFKFGADANTYIHSLFLSLSLLFFTLSLSLKWMLGLFALHDTCDFIVSFSNNAPDPEKDCAAVQEFFSKMEAAFRSHPLWSGSSEEELDNAGEGLEKYVMTKLFNRVFASNNEDVLSDEKLFQKMSLVQQFISPENLDIQPTFQNETSWLLAQKELQKINMYKSPRDKLMCILSYCKVINNILINASISSNENAPGADEFLPVLIYVTLKANPPQFHLNLLYIQRYRRQSKLVGEAAYFFTNILSAESFISNIDAKSLSLDEADFVMKLESARAHLPGMGSQSYQTGQGASPPPRDEPTAQDPKKEKTLLRSKSSDSLSATNETLNPNSEIPINKAESISDLENKGAATLLNDSNEASKVFKEYPYIFANFGDLRIGEVEGLLNDYKQLVFKYACLSKSLGDAMSAPSISPLQASKASEDHTTFSSDVQKKTETDTSVDDLVRALQGEGDNVHKLSDVKQEENSENFVQGRDEKLDLKVHEEADSEDTDLKKQNAEREGENSISQPTEEEDDSSKHPIAKDQNDLSGW